MTSLAGAYWRGDERNTQLTRIYGTAFYSQADRDAHLARLEEAADRPLFLGSRPTAASGAAGFTLWPEPLDASPSDRLIDRTRARAGE